MVDAPAGLGLRLGLPPANQVLLQGECVVLQGAVAEGAVLQGHGVGGAAPVKLDHPSLPDALAQLGHRVALAHS